MRQHADAWLNIDRDVLNICFCLGIVSTFESSHLKSPNSQLTLWLNQHLVHVDIFPNGGSFSGIGKATNLKVPSCHPDLDFSKTSTTEKRNVVEKGNRWVRLQGHKKTQFV